MILVAARQFSTGNAPSTTLHARGPRETMALCGLRTDPKVSAMDFLDLDREEQCDSCWGWATGNTLRERP